MRNQEGSFIWVVVDGKIGHEKQSLALANSIARKRKINIITVQRKSIIRIFVEFIYQYYKARKSIKKPDYIIGTGHGTHLNILTLQNLYGGRAVVIMKPTLPINWFDLCIIPKHDSVEPQAKVFLTEGAVVDGYNANRERDASKALILLGGPSKHFYWKCDDVLKQIKNIIDTNETLEFTISTSRRTPDKLRDKLINAYSNKATICLNYEDNWLEEQLSITKYTWVTMDSISMIYESISSGSNVLLINLPEKKSSKISREIERLITEKKLVMNEVNKKVNLSHFSEGIKISTAEQCAEYVLQRFK
jgi:uncharacterized protein